MKIRLCFLVLWIQNFPVLAQVERYDVVINEIMADPSPTVGLPNAEFIELKNISPKKIDLFRWRIIKGNTTAVISVSYLLDPDSVVVICPRTQAALFNAPAKVLGITSFPSLVNEGDLVALSAPDGLTIHAVAYSVDWYSNPVKAQGGWSLEMIDPFRPCDAGNWKASTNILGGTPGTENSAFKKGGKNERMVALQCIAVNANTLLLQLNQGADSLSLSTLSNYLLSSPAQVPASARAIPPLFNSVELGFQQPIAKQQTYELRAFSVAACRKNHTDSLFVKTGLYVRPDSSNIVINELLFDPPAGGADFVELYNKGSSVIDAKELYIASYGPAGQASGIWQVTDKSFNIFPGDHLVLTTDTAFSARTWPLKKDRLIEMKTLPSLPDDEGNIAVLNANGMIIDRFDYQATMHFSLLRNKEGVSLERIDFNNSSSNRDNWHSASSSSGYATPTLKNSQYNSGTAGAETIAISPELISPDNDGNADLLRIEYAFKENGSLLSVYLYSENGDFIDKIIDNRICGTSGSFYWNGHDRKDRPVKSGIYILVAEIFHPRGKRKVEKKVIGVKY